MTTRRITVPVRIFHKATRREVAREARAWGEEEAANPRSSVVSVPWVCVTEFVPHRYGVAKVRLELAEREPRLFEVLS